MPPRPTNDRTSCKQPWTRAAIRRHHSQRSTLIGLKLNKIGRVAELQDTPEVRGMITKVQHLVRIVGEFCEHHALTGRQHEILALAMAGLSNKQISARLGSSQRTIEVHWSRIFLKVGVHSRLEVAQKLLSWRLEHMERTFTIMQAGPRGLETVVEPRR